MQVEARGVVPQGPSYLDFEARFLTDVDSVIRQGLLEPAWLPGLGLQACTIKFGLGFGNQT